MKLALSTSPLLRTLDPIRRAALTTDASGLAVAAILTQPDDSSTWPSSSRCWSYESRKLTAAERNYPADVLELLAVARALRVLKHYLLGSGPVGAKG